MRKRTGSDRGRRGAAQHARALRESWGGNPPGGISIAWGRVRAAALVVLMLGSLVPAGVVPAAAAPDGMVNVPDGNITEDVPAGESSPVAVSDLRGSVLASDHAGTLQVTVTTPERAETYVNASAATIGSETGLVLVLSDDDNPDGRRVALPVPAVRETLGYVPDLVRGVHEDGEPWIREVSETDGFLVFRVPHFSSNTVTFDSYVDISADSAGEGRLAEYSLSGLDGTSNVSVGLSRRVTTQWDNVTVSKAANGTTVSVPVAGNMDPVGPGNGETLVELTGHASLSSFSRSGSVSPGGSQTIQISGNQPAESVTVSLSGNETTDAVSVSASGQSSGSSYNYYVGGNVGPESESVVFSGITTTEQVTKSASGLSSGSSLSIQPSGNLPPANGKVTVTASAGQTQTTDNVDSLGDGTTDFNRHILGEHGDGIKTEFLIKPQESGVLSRLSFSLVDSQGSDYDTSTDIYISEGNNVNKNFGEGTKVRSGWDATLSDGTQSVSISDYTVESGQTYTVELISDGKDGGTYDEVNIRLDDANSGAYSFYSNDMDSLQRWHAAVDLKITPLPRAVSVQTETGETVSLGDFSDGQTKSSSLDISLSDSSLSVSFSGGGTVDIQTEYTDRTASENPAIDLDADGSIEVSYNGVLKEGETVTKAVSLSLGPQTAETSLSDGTVGWTLDFTEVTAVSNPDVDVDGDGSAEAAHMGTLRSGESVTLSVPSGELSSGESSLEFGGSGPQYEYQVTGESVTKTVDPGVDVDGDGTVEVGYSGILGDGETVTREVPLGTDTSQVTARSSGGVVSLRFVLKERTETPAGAIEVNDATVPFGEINGSVDLVVSNTSLRDGNNRVNLTFSGGLSDDAPDPRAGVDYNHTALSSFSTNYTASRWSETYEVSEVWGSDRSNATLSLTFESDVVAIRSVEVATNGSSYSEVSESNISLDGTNLTVSLGDVRTAEETSVRVSGSRIRVQNGEISVVSPTTSGRLETTVRIEDRSQGFALGVGGSESSGKYLHYLSNESYRGEDATLLISDNGGQTLRVPNAPAGETFTVQTLDLGIRTDGDLVVEVVDPSERRLDVSPGPVEGDPYEVVVYDVVEGDTYGVVSLPRDDFVIDRLDAESNSTVVLSVPSDGSDTVEVGRLAPAGSGPGGGGGGGGGGADEGDRPLTRSPVVVAPLGVLLILGSFILVRRTSLPRWVGGITSFLTGMVVLESLSPGTVSNVVRRFGFSLAGGIGRVSAVLALAAAGFVLWAGYRVVQRLTSREDVNLRVVRRGGGGSN